MAAFDTEAFDIDAFSVSSFFLEDVLSESSGRTFAEWILNNGALSSADLITRMMEFFDSQSVSEGALPDRLYEWLGNEGYTGSLSDRLGSWSEANLTR